MSLIRVYIATTNGPVEVQRIAEEDPEVRSVVCLNGTSEALPISPGYDSFVRKPTGVIERLYGHRVYRVDVAKPITDGKSWQLGLLVAHALQSVGRLAGPNDKADEALWLTGEVNHDLHIGTVSHVSEKLVASSALFRDLNAHGHGVRVVVPEGNAGDVSAAVMSSAIKVEALADAAAFVESCVGGALVAQNIPTPIVTRRLSWPVVVLGTSVLAGGAYGLLYWNDYPFADALPSAVISSTPASIVTPPSEEQTAPPAYVLSDFEIEVLERRAPQGKTCGYLSFANQQPIDVPRKVTGMETLTSQGEGLCALTYHLTNTGTVQRQAGLIVTAIDGRVSGTSTLSETKVLQPGAGLVVTVKIPAWRSGQPLKLAVLAAASMGRGDVMPSQKLPDMVSLMAYWRQARGEASAMPPGVSWRMVEHRVMAK